MQTRRMFLRSVAAGAVGATVLRGLALRQAQDCAHAAEAGGPAKKPNVLFILGDDVTYSDLGCYGGKAVATPNIDALAADGLKFTRAYCAMSMCAPFRAELYTGLYPVRNGVAYNHSQARPGTKSVVHHLGELGYRVGLVGKKHASPAATFPFESAKGELVEAAAEYINRDSDKPFCLFVCSHNAHPAWRSGDVSNIDVAGMKLPPVIHDNPVTRKTFGAYLAEVGALDDEVGQLLAALDKSGKAADTLVMFSSEQGWDFAFGKWTCWDIGLHTALIARWPGRIKAGRETTALVQMADVAPTLIDAAGGEPGTYKLDGTSFLGVLEGKADKHRRYVYGLHNNVPEGAAYPIRSIRDERLHYIRNLKPDVAYHEKHLMTDGLAKRYDLQWWRALKDAAEAGDAAARKLYDKYHHRPAEELYLVDADPWEQTNLAADPKYAAEKKRLRAALERWMAEQKDPGAALDTREAYDANKAAGKKRRK